MLAILGASGKIGSATLSSLLKDQHVPAASIVATTSSQPNSTKWASLAQTGVTVRYATFDDAASLETAFAGCSRLLLISSPRIALDFHDAPPGHGREKDHIVAIDAARRAGVKHVYYASLAFKSDPAVDGIGSVMTAHLRTEAYLASLSDVSWTVMRQGLYNPSWPLYLGRYDCSGDERREILIANDGPVSWTSIADLGAGNAVVLAAPVEEYAGKSFFLSSQLDIMTLAQVGELLSKVKGYEITVKVVGQDEFEDFYTQMGIDEGQVKWGTKSFSGMSKGLAKVKDDTLARLLAGRERPGERLEQAITAMVSRN
jgi:uncharacterized protein YbjT (DUF2867 family)